MQNNEAVVITSDEFIAMDNDQVTNRLLFLLTHRGEKSAADIVEISEKLSQLTKGMAKRGGDSGKRKKN